MVDASVDPVVESRLAWLSFTSWHRNYPSYYTRRQKASNPSKIYQDFVYRLTSPLGTSSGFRCGFGPVLVRFCGFAWDVVRFWFSLTAKFFLRLRLRDVVRFCSLFNGSLGDGSGLWAGSVYYFSTILNLRERTSSTLLYSFLSENLNCQRW